MVVVITMNKFKSIFTLSFLCLSVSLSACTDKKPQDATAKPEAEDKTVNLFNGKDLTGWKKLGGTGQYKVEDGCIVGFGENVKGNTFLSTEERFTDFELTFQFKFDHRKGNSGVMFRANQKPSDDGNGRVFGYQCEGDNKDRSWTAGIYDEARRGWLYPTKGKSPEAVEAAKKFTEQGKKLFKWDDWNTIKIRCEGNHIQTWLNGEKRVDFKDTNKEHDTREGFIGLQVHSGKSFQARWKNIVLKKLN